MYIYIIYICMYIYVYASHDSCWCNGVTLWGRGKQKLLGDSEPTHSAQKLSTSNCQESSDAYTYVRNMCVVWIALLELGLRDHKAGGGAQP